MQRYLNSCVFRVNRKKESQETRTTDLFANALQVRLSYKGLVYGSQ